jgi:hypothetical protein
MSVVRGDKHRGAKRLAISAMWIKRHSHNQVAPAAL